MKFLIVGLGSMGKRRIRCLQTLKYTDIFGFDLRDDRRRESEEKYKIKTFNNIDKAISAINPDVMVISVPPDYHHIYMKIAVKNKINFFVEVNILDTDMEDIIRGVKSSGIIGSPSSTLVFHPAIKIVKHCIETKELGQISNILFHSGQYLPDWHTYEKVSEFYVSNPLTGGAREIVPFELTWLVNVFGFPKSVSGNVKKTITIDGAEKIDDTYNFLMDFGFFLATVTIDVVSRFATRRLVINGDKKQLIWDWNEKLIKIFDPATSKWEERPYFMADAVSGYNQNIGENMYIEELNAYIESVLKKKEFVNSLETDHKVLQLLYSIEESSKNGKHVNLR